MLDLVRFEANVVEETVRAPRLVRFGGFEVDLRAGELRKNGAKLKLTGQPFQVLTILLEQSGEVVTREELQKRLWPETFVDFEHNLNTAINKIREVLGDSSESPRFIETVPRRGYRFVAPVNGVTPAAQTSIVETQARPVPRGSRRFFRLHLNLAPALLLAILLGGIIWRAESTRMPRIIGSRRLTFTGQVVGPRYPFGWAEGFPSLATDGNRVYYSLLQQWRGRLGYVSLSGGNQEVMPLGFSGSQVDLRHISPDGSMLLVYGAPDWVSAAHLWVFPTAGGGPRRIPNIEGHDGAWSADGRQIAFANGPELFVADTDGGDSHKIATTHGNAFWLRWSPDSARIRLTVIDPKNGKSTLWECKPDGTDLHSLLLSRDKQADECCGEWTKDGRYFVYRVFRNNHPDIWALREKGFILFGANSAQLTTGPLDSVDAVPSPNGRQLLTLEAQERSELHRLDLKTHELTPYLPGFGATDIRRIPGTEMIAYVESHGRETKVWRSREDGTERLQLTGPPLDVLRIAPSPDGKQIALMGKMPNERWRIYLVPSGGGSLRAMTPENQSVADPTWSPDGRAIMFGAVPDWWPGGLTMRPPISVVTIDDGQIRAVPGSEGLWSPRWSPNGRYVIGMTQDWTRLMLFDLATRQKTELARGDGFDFPEWYPDSESIYVTDHSRNQTKLIRIIRANGKQQEVLDLESLNPKAQGCWMITPPTRESLLISCIVPNGDIYAFDMDLP
jgi:Tol biopolymer transport system component/DNA-binding winged helix-turn-helix (wHTH) protein